VVTRPRQNLPYVGRYAPSPSGPLHVGNGFAAFVARQRASERRGICKLRIEDLDTPRVAPGATAAIIDDLAWLGLRFDGEVLIQSQHVHRYLVALSQLRADGLLYACACSRKELASAPHAGEEGPRYVGTCRDRGLPFDDPQLPVAWRWRLPHREVTIDDMWQGRFTQHLTDAGDPVLRRKDGLIAYQLAVVVDDAYQGVTEVVRAIDLLPESPRQVALHEALGFVAPRFAHLPMVVGANGQRISKRDGSTPLRSGDAQELRNRFAQMYAEGLHRRHVAFASD
jgi:glutamyl-Q tRNA(Asp) synthetase